MTGNRFYKFEPNENGKSKFEQMLDIFMQMLNYTSGDVSEALQWLNELDKQYKITDNQYGMGDFIDDLKENGYIKDDPEGDMPVLTKKSEQTIRKRSLEEIFGNSRKASKATTTPIVLVRVRTSILICVTINLVTNSNRLILPKASVLRRSITVLNISRWERRTCVSMIRISKRKPQPY